MADLVGERPGGELTARRPRGWLQNLAIANNTIGGPGSRTGAVEDIGASLTGRNIAFTGNTFTSGAASVA